MVSNTVYGHNLTKFVPLNVWFRWWMLRTFLESKMSAKTIRNRLGWGHVKFSRVLFASEYDISLRDLGVWFYVIHGDDAILDFKLIPLACGNNVDNRQ